ncbi:MAG: NAD(P)-binding domain-containing protein [Nitrososphaerales archaeon]
MSFTIIGLSRIGLFTAIRLLQAGYKVIGYDRSGYQISRVRQGHAFEDDRKNSAFIRRLVGEGVFILTETLDSALKESNVLIICEKAPTNNRKVVQSKGLYELAELIGKRLRGGLVIVFQTLAPPGTARIFVKRCEEISGLVCGKDFNFVCTPSPLIGDEEFETNPVRVMTGSSVEVVSIISEVFEAAGLGKSVLVSSFEAAEISVMRLHMELCLKQALRAELSLLCDKMNVNIDETEIFLKSFENKTNICKVLFARNSAAIVTKLLEAGRMKGVNLPICRRARDICWNMPKLLAKEVVRSLKSRDPKTKSLTVVGSFREFDSVEKSSNPEIEVVDFLNRAKLRVKISRFGETEGRKSELGVYLQPLEKALKGSKNVVILTPQEDEVLKICDLDGVNVLDLYK